MVLVGPPPPEASEECRTSDRFPDSGLIEVFEGGGEDQLLSQGEDEEGLEAVVVELSVVEQFEEKGLIEEEEKKSKRESRGNGNMNFVLRSGSSVSFMVDTCGWCVYFVVIPPFPEVGGGGGGSCGGRRRRVLVSYWEGKENGNGE